jgi:hypothetical protein
MPPHAVLDFDALLDHSVLPEWVEQACDEVANAAGDLDRAKLGQLPVLLRRCVTSDARPVAQECRRASSIGSDGVEEIGGGPFELGGRDLR